MVRPGAWFPRRSSFSHRGYGSRQEEDEQERSERRVGDASGCSLRSSFVRYHPDAVLVKSRQLSAPYHVHLGPAIATAVTIISARLSSRQQRFV